MYNESVQNVIPANLTYARIKYDQVVETLGAEETDKNISLITTGNDAGTILLPVAGRYSLHATFALNEAVPPAETYVCQIAYKINNVIKETVACAVQYRAFPSRTLGTAQIATTFLIKESDLTGSGPNTSAKLEIIGAHDCAAQRSVLFGSQDSNPDINWQPFTMATINFLG